MLISLAWLSDWLGDKVDTNSPEKIAEQLTLQGLEVESIEPAAPEFNSVVVGEVVSLEQHPDADKLRVAKVNVGQDDALQIVCGAANIEKGGRYPTALIGAVLPGDFHIKASELRGVESLGMLCARDELGLAAEKNKAEGLMTLHSDAPVGTDLREYLQLDDSIIEIAITPDRGDCFSYRGVARDVLAGHEQALPELNQIVPETIETSTPSSVNVTVADEAACPFSLAQKVTGVDNSGQSPTWLTERLRRAGVRAISPVVDVTNYVMLTLGTPLHAFDGDVIGDDIVVRMAEKTDTFNLLDGKTVTDQEDVLLIATPERPLALAGVMGGETGEVSEKTTTVILESAWFAPEVIAGKGRRFGLTTDASQRYERGVDFSLQDAAARLAIKLIVDICGGQAEIPTISTNESKFPAREPMTLTGKRLDAVLGARFPKRRIEPILRDLGFAVDVQEKYTYQVTPPVHRFDILDEVDLIGELARLWGYDQIANVPCTNDFIGTTVTARKDNDLVFHQTLPNLGYAEAICYSFVDSRWIARFGSLFYAEHKVTLKNPISTEMDVMRTSLVPSLVTALQYNLNRQSKRVKLYEIGQQYRATQDGFGQTPVIAGLAYGEGKALQWGFKARALDFFDIKGDVETLLASLGVDDVTFTRGERDFLHPGQSADVVIGDKVVGFVGALHPKLLADIDIEEKVYVFELNRALLTDAKKVRAKAISKFPTVRRDIALQLKQSVAAEDVLAAIKSTCGEQLLDVTLFDVYVGRNIPRGTKSMAFALFFSDSSQTMTDAMADELVQAVTAQLAAQFNAELRK